MKIYMDAILNLKLLKSNIEISLTLKHNIKFSFTGIAFDDDAKKEVLITLINLHRPPKESQYSIDQILRAAGHPVMRLPPYHCELNPIELSWSYQKGYVERKRLCSTNGRYSVCYFTFFQVCIDCNLDRYTFPFFFRIDVNTGVTLLLLN